MMADSGKRTYAIHAGRELELMLSGEKPMSVFYRCTLENFDEMGGQDFEQYVKAGRMSKNCFYVFDKILNFKIKYSIYTNLGEEWRAKIYKELKKSGQISWSKEKEFIEGILLGYSFDENFEHNSLG